MSSVAKLAWGAGIVGGGLIILSTTAAARWTGAAIFLIGIVLLLAVGPQPGAHGAGDGPTDSGAGDSGHGGDCGGGDGGGGGDGD